LYRILVVDDDKDMCNIIATILTNEGYKIVKAYDSSQAIKKVEESQFNLLILDYKLPGADGIEVLQEIRNRGLLVKTIMISAYGSIPIKKRAAELDVYQFLDKPFDLVKLKKIVKNGLMEK